MSAAVLIGLVVVIIAGGILGSVSLLTHFGVIGIHSGATTATVVRGGTWTDDFYQDIGSLIPNGDGRAASVLVDQALYLPLFYGDAQGDVHPGAASEIPTVQNGGISADAKTWTFHLRPHLVWSDGQPYDARDVDYSWKTWSNPKFGANSYYGLLAGLNLITSADISADYLTITFHLKQAYAPFLSGWVDGIQAPLPAHHFSQMPPDQILKSPENRNPQVVSGPFMMAESVQGDHYTLVRNPHYYRASEGLPYLDKVVFRIADPDTILKDLQANSIDSASWLDVSKAPLYQRLTHYTLVTPPVSATFEALFFNFHNTVLASHPEVRQAMAMAIDHQALIGMALHGFATLLCTDHPSAMHPGYDHNASCPVFDPAAANKMLDDNGWVRGPDGVRTKGGQRLEFEYSAPINSTNEDRFALEAIVQRDMQAAGIKLDIQNYAENLFFSPFLTGGTASPPTGALAGRFDIAEYYSFGSWDPDDSALLECDLTPPNGFNDGSYCNTALDALYKQELATADAGERQNIFEQIHLIYLTQFPFIVLFGFKGFYIVRNVTHNFQPSPENISDENIAEWWCDGGNC